jgi:hypothetical protein
MNPGIGTEQLVGNIFYARAKDGAGVFFAREPGIIRIIGKATKANEDQVIRLIYKHFVESK